MSLKTCFGDKRIIGLAGEKSSGKTNNIVYLVQQFRKLKPDVPIYAFGINVPYLLTKFNVKEISSLRHLVGKTNSIFLLDEFQKLKLNDRRNKRQLAQIVDFVYHDNNYIMLSSPNIREFNTVIGSVIERWLIKTVRADSCVNGSQLKLIIQEYEGRFKSLNAINVPVDRLLVIDEHQDIVLKCGYVKAADTKRKQKSVF